MATPTVRYFDEITLGMSGEFKKIVKAEDIKRYAELTGDNNPIHLDADYAKTSIFGQRISHGMLVAGFISSVFGRNFPGPGWIYISQSLQFKAPVFIGDQTTAVVVVEKLIPKKQMVQFKTFVSVGGENVIAGTATLLAPKHPS